MRPHEVYQQYKRPSLSRIDSILALFRHADARLQRAGVLFAEKRPEEATALLMETSLIVGSLSANLGGTTDPTELNFLRLYEFVAHQLTLKTPEGVEAATRVMRPLMEGFEAVREQALLLEKQQVIPSLEREQLVQLTA